jgi:hypothetical protein
MKLKSKDIDVEVLMAAVKRQSHDRAEPVTVPIAARDAEAEPVTFHVQAMGEDADCVRPLPIETHRGGAVGSAVTLAKRLFRTTCQIFINEALARQRRFNAEATDAYGQLAAEVLRLREKVARLEAHKKETPAPDAAASPKRRSRARKRSS